MLITGHAPLEKRITSATSAEVDWADSGPIFARSRYGPHHGIGLPTRLCVVSSLSLRAAPGRLARPPTAARLAYPIQR